MCGCQLSCENSKQQKKRSEIKHPLIQVSIDRAVYMMSSLLCFFFLFCFGENNGTSAATALCVESYCQ